ncbi:MAG: hypothetical protein K8F91_11170 [Candidatus Obscuribacterales bacterium]|nr:hypothetical protein [Candidatus Obscuribacterales bacterium]
MKTAVGTTAAGESYSPGDMEHFIQASHESRLCHLYSYMLTKWQLRKTIIKKKYLLELAKIPAKASPILESTVASSCKATNISAGADEILSGLGYYPYARRRKEIQPDPAPDPALDHIRLRECD